MNIYAVNPKLHSTVLSHIFEWNGKLHFANWLDLKLRNWVPNWRGGLNGCSVQADKMTSLSKYCPSRAESHFQVAKGYKNNFNLHGWIVYQKTSEPKNKMGKFWFYFTCSVDCHPKHKPLFSSALSLNSKNPVGNSANEKTSIISFCSRLSIFPWHAVHTKD